MEWKGDCETPVRLQYKIILNGARGHNNYLRLVLDPAEGRDKCEFWFLLISWLNSSMLVLLQIDPWNYPACSGGGSGFTYSNNINMVNLWFLNHLVATINRTQDGASGSKEQSTILGKPELIDLTDAVYHKVVDRWKMLGVHLWIPEGTLYSASSSPTQVHPLCPSLLPQNQGLKIPG